RRPAPVLTFPASTRLPVRIVTLLVPTEDPLASPPAVSALAGEDRGPAGVVFGDDDALVVVGEHDIIVEPGKPRARGRSVAPGHRASVVSPMRLGRSSTEFEGQFGLSPEPQSDLLTNDVP